MHKHICVIKCQPALTEEADRIGEHVSQLLGQQLKSEVVYRVEPYDEVLESMPDVHVHAMIIDPFNVYESDCDFVQGDVVDAICAHLDDGNDMLYTWDTVKGIQRRVGQKSRHSFLR